MSTRKHAGHPHLTGEHRWGDTGQLVMLVLFLGIWISDSFIYDYSTFLLKIVPDYIRMPAAGLVLVCGWLLARGGMKQVFGTKRDKPELISSGVFRIVRHPIYTGALLFYLGSILITLSIASAAFWLVIIAFYISIARYEERILTGAFGEEYKVYQKRTGMLFPRLFRTRT